MGGWVVDQQSMEQIHSSYLMAHGMGVPVADATTSFEVEDTKVYHVWALTRDWTAVWGVKNSAGKFRLAVDGKLLPTVLGTNGKDWAFQKAGKIRLKKGKHTLSLRDLTGFNGRCDAVYLTTDENVPSSEISEIDGLRKRLNWKEVDACEEKFDFIVVGGGVAGICTALSAKRSGVKTLLIHDREVLGGCNSSEIRVCMGGRIHLGPFDKIGNIVKEIAPVAGDPSYYKEEYFEDHKKRLAFKNDRFGSYVPHKIAFHTSVTEVEKEGDKIVAVVCTDTLSGKKTKYYADLFSDCSGDGILSRLAGAEVMYGRESKEEFGEGLGAAEHQNLVMGHSIRWYAEKGEKTAFPDVDWNLGIDEKSCLFVTSGDWEQETGFRKHMVDEIEYIRDYGLRAIYSNWAFQKNKSAKKAEYAGYTLKWVSALGGKRESYRVKGDWIFKQQDIECLQPLPDGTACMTWSIDLHFPEPDNEKQFGGEAFRSFAYHRGIVKPCQVPYRCLYSKDVDNLFLGGRLVSMTHVAFSVVRVMRTLGQLGEVVGLASAICKKHGCTPRAVYLEHLEELKESLLKGVPSPDAFDCDVGVEECYHYKDLGWLFINGYDPEKKPKGLEKFKRGIEYLGFDHKYELPDDLK